MGAWCSLKQWPRYAEGINNVAQGCFNPMVLNRRMESKPNAESVRHGANPFRVP